MKMPDKVYEYPIEWRKIAGGFEFFTYQLAFGISIKWWTCLKTPCLRLYFGPFKLWLYIKRSEFRLERNEAIGG